ncbi:hypothetical protein LIER_06542 [Lithospermum erythrorhizon]|uniref:Homeobox domain-containing protein n=1 Tax=Lithospermum erythrorhizon TaxID=34254 RepID=A0AAV3P6N3_LITER
MGVDDFCNTGLVLGLGFSSSAEVVPRKIIDENQKPKTHLINLDQQQLAKGSLNFEPSLTLSLPGEAFDQKFENSSKVNHDNYKGANCNDQYLSRQNSAITSFSNVSVKREREIVSEEAETTTERVSSTRVSDEDEDSPNGRKKLRLTKAQSALLEESFKQHSTLNPKQKQELARELNLRARQVEVWFQNRRARTKLKQTEVDCEFLKKCCDTLTDENRRLHKELQELKALKLGSQPFYMQMPAATLTMCPACERIGGGINPHGETTTSSSKTGLISIAPKSHFFNPFTKSAAC